MICNGSSGGERGKVETEFRVERLGTLFSVC